MIGKIHRSQVGNACRESRTVMKSKYVLCERYGWIDFNKHLFFFRDDKFDGGILKNVGEKQGLLEHVQHIAIHPREWWRTVDTFELLRKHCRQLRTVVVIGPWLEPFAPGWKEELGYAPDEDFAPIFSQSPAEMELTELFNAIDGDYAAELARRSQYKARLDELMVHIREVFDDEQDSSWYYTRRLVHLIEERDMAGFPGLPRLFLRRRDELCSPAI
ncbi:hypothetical protein ACHAQH_003974 [Verticillium albo-atrum]